MKTIQISITITKDILSYIDEIAAVNGRSRSAMINWILTKEKAQDEALDDHMEAINGAVQ